MSTTNLPSRINLRDLVVLEGANLLSRKPVIGLVLNYENVDPMVLRQIAGVLVSLLTRAAERDAGIGGSTLADSLGGRVSSVAELVACAALELQKLIGHNLQFAVGLRQNNPDRNIAAFEYRDASLGRRAGQTAIDLIAILLDKRTREESGGRIKNISFSPLDNFLEKTVVADSASPSEETRCLDAFLRSAASIDVGHMANLIVGEAEQRDLPWFRLLDFSRMIQVGQGVKQQRFYRGYTQNTSWLADRIVGHKYLAFRFLRAQNIPAAENVRVSSPEAAVAAANRIGFPVVVKPDYGAEGVGISLDLSDDEAVSQGYRLAHEYGRVIVERFVAGDHYRLTVIHGKVLSVVRQKPAHVVGDGRNTIARLVEAEN